MADSGCENLRSQEAGSFLYFAYGSNLLTERIHLRNPSAAFVGAARLQVSAPRPAPATSSPLYSQEGVKSGTYDPIEVNVYTQEGKKITCRSYQMKSYECAPPSPQYKKVICMGAKENGLPLEYQKKLNAIEPNDYKGKVSEEIEDIIKKGETKTR
ncbi:hypothetical protein HPG69_000619 [Diceros bicornis minor]|uniref:gamma-glutamylcyclotransferase n=1 Tax=Diceros bicornis minor TaxID=77932 RepID=A0A7J7FI24_DICBM|nr:hypothetical protein HPG69_000619 [Diceros bicornis minor]